MSKFPLFLAIALATVLATDAAGQQFRAPTRPGMQGPGGNRGNQGGNNNNNNNAPREVKLPDDPKLLELHKNFVLGAEKLAAEYERMNQIDKARNCYEEIIRLVPTYTQAAEKLATIKQKEATAEHRTIDIYANKGWQDVGVGVAAGKPVSIKASGSWTMKMQYNLSPDGIEIPKELQNFPLGSLVAKIATSPTDEEAKIINIGTSKSFTSDIDGRLYLRMYDSDPEDNLGKISVFLEGTFKK
jgi:hypothetical protein